MDQQNKQRNGSQRTEVARAATSNAELVDFRFASEGGKGGRVSVAWFL
jgi:hypothetical protein